jgi:hypothetical protein
MDELSSQTTEEKIAQACADLEIVVNQIVVLEEVLVGGPSGRPFRRTQLRRKLGTLMVRRDQLRTAVQGYDIVLRHRPSPPNLK